MPSFKTLSMLFTLAASAFVSAVPTPAPSAAVVVGSADKAAVDARDSLTIGVILSTATTNLQSTTAKLTVLTADTITVDVVTEVTADIKVILNGVLSDVQSLSGEAFEVVFGCAEDVLDLNALATIISGLLCLVFEALGFVLSIVGDVDYDVICPLLQDVACLLGEIIKVVFSLLGGLVVSLLVILVPLIANIVNVILSLNVTVIISIFGL